MSDKSGNQAWAYYSKFGVGDSVSKYKLSVGGYKGDAGDDFTSHNGMKFSASDQDNDLNAGTNCSGTYGPGWNRNCCGACILNRYNGIIWFAFQGLT